MIKTEPIIWNIIGEEIEEIENRENRFVLVHMGNEKVFPAYLLNGIFYEPSAYKDNTNNKRCHCIDEDVEAWAEMPMIMVEGDKIND